MTPKKAILLTILGIFAAWLIIRGIQSWEARHAADPQVSAAALCLSDGELAAPPAACLF